MSIVFDRFLAGPLVGHVLDAAHGIVGGVGVVQPVVDRRERVGGRIVGTDRPQRPSALCSTCAFTRGIDTCPLSAFAAPPEAARPRSFSSDRAASSRQSAFGMYGYVNCQRTQRRRPCSRKVEGIFTCHCSRFLHRSWRFRSYSFRLYLVDGPAHRGLWHG